MAKPSVDASEDAANGDTTRVHGVWLRDPVRSTVVRVDGFRDAIGREGDNGSSHLPGHRATSCHHRSTTAAHATRGEGHLPGHRTATRHRHYLATATHSIGGGEKVDLVELTIGRRWPYSSSLDPDRPPRPRHYLIRLPPAMASGHARLELGEFGRERVEIG